MGNIEGLKKQGFPRNSYYLKTFWMDTKELYNNAQKIAYISKVAIEHTVAFRPKIMFTSDDDALRSVAIPYVNSTLNTNYTCYILFSGYYFAFLSFSL